MTTNKIIKRQRRGISCGVMFPIQTVYKPPKFFTEVLIVSSSNPRHVLVISSSFIITGQERSTLAAATALTWTMLHCRPVLLCATICHNVQPGLKENWTILNQEMLNIAERFAERFAMLCLIPWRCSRQWLHSAASARPCANFELTVQVHQRDETFWNELWMRKNISLHNFTKTVKRIRNGLASLTTSATSPTLATSALSPATSLEGVEFVLCRSTLHFSRHLQYLGNHETAWGMRQPDSPRDIENYRTLHSSLRICFWN